MHSSAKNFLKDADYDFEKLTDLVSSNLNDLFDMFDFLSMNFSEKLYKKSNSYLCFGASDIRSKQHFQIVDLSEMPGWNMTT